MALADLHLHTTASDGRLTPSQLVHLCARRGLRVIAITDHDTTAALEEALETARLYPGLTVIPGIEFSTDIPGTEVHLLAYFIDHRSPALQEVLARFRQGRVERARRMVERLAQLGYPLEWDRVVALAGEASLGRPHIALAMVEKGYVATPKEAFERFLGRNGPAYVEREKLPPEEAVRLALRFHGLPVLAHPNEVQGVEEVLPPLVRAGLVGLEVYYGNYDGATQQRLLALAHHYHLLPTGGSDYHALGNPDEVEPGTVGPPLEVARQLMEMAGKATA